MQDSRSIQLADARLQIVSGSGARLLVVLGISLTLLVTLLVLGTAFVLTSEDGTRTIVSDFRVFWAAARLMLDGDPIAAFNAERIDAEYNSVTDDWMPWLYPPGYLLVVTPLGALPYAFAFLAMTLLSIGAMALAARPFAGGVALVWMAMALAPAYMPALVIGQNSLIWLALLLAALNAMRAGRAVLAGVLIGCLTLKPQLGLMIPVALLAAGQWRTILAAGATAILLAALPTLVVGPEYWHLLAERLGQHADRMVSLVGELPLTVGTVHFMTMLGLGPSVALALQWGVVAVAAMSVFLFWRSDRITFDAKAALLLIAILLSAPYLWYYEAALTAAAGLFLLRAGILTRRLPHLFLLVLLWIGAGLQSLDLVFPALDDRYLGALIVTPVLCLTFVLCWIHLARSADPPEMQPDHGPAPAAPL